MDELEANVRRAVVILEELVWHTGQHPGSLKQHHRNVLALEIASLRKVHKELEQGKISRRAWSLGYSTIPILTAKITAVRRSSAEVPEHVLDQASEAVEELSKDFIRVAEGK